MSLANPDVVKLNRQELYDRVWKTPASKLAKEFGISDVGLAKVCKRHKVPRPPRGYWAQLAFGKRVRQPSLPKIDDEGLDEIRIFRQQFFGQPVQVEAQEESKTAKITVSETLAQPHPLVDATRKYLRSTTAGDDGVLPPDRNACLAIRVSRASLDRALRIFDAFVKHWESLGGSVSVGLGDRYRNLGTELELHGDSICIELFEEIDRISTRPDVCRNWRYRNCKYQRTGRLVLKIDTCYGDAPRSRWADGKRQRLEAMLDSFTDGVLGILGKMRLRRLDTECEDRQRAAVRAIREAAAQRKKAEEQRRTRLLRESKAWKRACEIRSYLAAIRTKVDAGELRITDEKTFASWIEWAAWFADNLDPLTAAPPRPEFVQSSTKTAIDQLDLTKNTRTIVDQLAVKDTDELFAVEFTSVQKLCRGWRNSEWDEICRVLEGLGYPVVDRYRGYFR